MDPKLLDLSLAVKIPQLPRIKTVWSSGKIGEELRQPLPFFTLDYPYNHHLSIAYNCLHDPILQDYHTCKDILKLLKRRGLVTSDNKVVCTLKEFNEYRQYLSRQKLRAEQELRRQEEMTRPALAKSKRGPKLPGATNISRPAERWLKGQKPSPPPHKTRQTIVKLGQKGAKLPRRVSTDAGSQGKADVAADGWVKQKCPGERTSCAKTLEPEVLEMVEKSLEEEVKATTSGSTSNVKTKAKQIIQSAIQQICQCGPAPSPNQDFPAPTEQATSQGGKQSCAAEDTLPSVGPQSS